VPEILRYDQPRGLIALEDLGDRTFEQAVLSAPSGDRRRLYRLAIAEIARLQRHAARGPDPDCLAFERGFDEILLRWELDHFREWLLEADRNARLDPTERRTVDEAFGHIARTLARGTLTVAHRDYQSRNLMVLPGPPPDGVSLRVIDFQDALLGSKAYDLVALLRDSYVELSPEEVEQGIDDYVEAAAEPDPAGFRRLFRLQTVERKLKDAGRFVYLDRVRGNAGFRRHIPASLRYARDALAALPELAGLREILGRHVSELAAPP
jgi:aminoglycoside/choline kinase family phosphotransferase